MSLRLRAEEKEELLMKILIYGAGVIGSLYAVYFSRAGCSVFVYARGHRLNVLKEKGLLYWEKRQIKKVNISVLDKIKPDDCYDYIFLTVQEKHLHTALQNPAFTTDRFPFFIWFNTVDHSYNGRATVIGKFLQCCMKMLFLNGQKNVIIAVIRFYFIQNGNPNFLHVPFF